MRFKSLCSVLAATCLAGPVAWTAPASAQRETPPASEQSESAKIYGFKCYNFDNAYVIGLGDIDKPTGDVAMSSEKTQPLKGSGSHAIVLVRSSIKDYSVEGRCSTIAARMTNLALANNSATPIGILELTKQLVPGEIKGQQVIAIDKVTPENVLASIGQGIKAEQALETINKRIRRVATKQVLTDSLKDADIVIFEVIEITPSK
jgi:hypothetical protein